MVEPLRYTVVPSRRRSGNRHDLIKLCQACCGTVLEHGLFESDPMARELRSKALVGVVHKCDHRQISGSQDVHSILITQKTPLDQKGVIRTRCYDQQFFIGIVLPEHGQRLRHTGVHIDAAGVLPDR